MWAELQQLQSFVRSHFELPCLSAHRRVDGAVCPACRLSAQAFWFEDREVGGVPNCANCQAILSQGRGFYWFSLLMLPWHLFSPLTKKNNNSSRNSIFNPSSNTKGFGFRVHSPKPSTTGSFSQRD